MSSVNHVDFIELGGTDLRGALEAVSPHAAQCSGGKVANATRGPPFQGQQLRRLCIRVWPQDLKCTVESLHLNFNSPSP